MESEVRLEISDSSHRKSRLFYSLEILSGLCNINSGKEEIFVGHNWGDTVCGT